MGKLVNWLRANLYPVPLVGILLVDALVAGIVFWGRDGAIVVATAVTALATGVLAMFTKRLATVTKALAPEPAIVPALAFWDGNVFLELHNAGGAAAVDLHVTVTWEVGNSVKGAETYSHEWRAKVLPSGARVRFNPREVAGGHLQGDHLVAYNQVTVKGTMTTSQGEPRVINTAIKEPGAFYDFEVDSKRQYTSAYEPTEIAAAELQKIRAALETVAKQRVERD